MNNKAVRFSFYLLEMVQWGKYGKTSFTTLTPNAWIRFHLSHIPTSSITTIKFRKTFSRSDQRKQHYRHAPQGQDSRNISYEGF